MMKILLVSSSSGGHVYPCLTAGEYFKKMGHEVKYLGIKGKIEEKIIKNDLIILNINSSFKKSFSLHGIKKISRERKKIINILKEHDVIICFGGFITFLVTFFNLKTKRKLYLHEQNVVLGDSIKYSYPFCEKLFLSFNNELTNLKKSVFTSNPTTSLVKENHIQKKKRVLFIFGSLSSETCLNKVKEFLNNTTLNNLFCVVTGDKYYHIFGDLKKYNIIIKKNINIKYELENFDIVFCRGGATSLLEFLYSGIEIVCIPSPYVKNNHQEKNAVFLKNKGYIHLLQESEFNILNIENYILQECKLKKYVDKINSLEAIYNEVIND